MMRGTTIDIFKVGLFRSSLLEDLTMTAPANLRVAGCEYGGDRITSTLHRSKPPHARMTRSVWQPGRGEFDLWDLGLDVLLVYRYPSPLYLLNAVSYEREEGHCALVPLRSTGQDLEAARRIASSTIFSGSRSAFVLLNTEDPDRQHAEQLTSIGPVAPTQFSFRENPSWPPLPPGPVSISDVAFTEGMAMWKWLIDFLDIPSVPE